MAIFSRLTALEFNKKLRLERRMLKQLRKLHRMQVTEFRTQLAAVGSVGNAFAASTADGVLVPMLNKHFDQTDKLFRGTVNKRLPQRARITSLESQRLDGVLSGLKTGFVAEHSAAITRTTQKNMAAAAEEAIEQLGATATRAEVAEEAAQKLRRKLAGRETGIGMFETQSMAESIKEAEVQQLVGGNSDFDVHKEWHSQGDSVVREAHLFAEVDPNNRVTIEEPFTVDGESLMFPGDTSLGASLGNVINCRCSSVVDADEVATARTA